MNNNTKREYKIGILYGEGIGYDIIEQTKTILSAISNKFDAVFDYAVGPTIKTPIKSKRGIVNPVYSFHEFAMKNKMPVISGALSGGLVYSIRKRFGLYYKLVPLKSLAGHRTEVYKKATDILLIRQNDAGVYFGRHGFLKTKDNTRIAFQNIRYHEDDINKIASVAFRYATKRRRKVTLLLKEDGLPEISSLWREVFEDRQREFRKIDFEILNVDTAAGELLSRPSNFDVVVTLNYDGDIICDSLVSFIFGSRSMGCSGNFNMDGFAVYQTVHGGAKDLVGKNKANPIGQILSSAMMLDFSFGLREESKAIRKGIEIVLNDGYRTQDIFQSGCKRVSTQEMGNLIAEAILEQ